MTGKLPMAPPLALPLVDVRDVAMLHVAAIDLEAAKGERFAATSETLQFSEITKTLKDWDSSLKTPKRDAPIWLLRIMSFFSSDAKMITSSLGLNLAVSGAKAERVFDFKFISAKDAIIGSAEAVKRKML